MSGSNSMQAHSNYLFNLHAFHSNKYGNTKVSHNNCLLSLIATMVTTLQLKKKQLIFLQGCIYPFFKWVAGYFNPLLMANSSCICQLQQEWQSQAYKLVQAQPLTSQVPIHKHQAVERANLQHVANLTVWATYSFKAHDQKVLVICHTM